MTVRFWYLGSGAGGGTSGTLFHSALIGLLNDDHLGYPYISKGFGPPPTIPSREGLIYIDLTNNNAYMAYDTVDSGSWAQIISGSAATSTLGTPSDGSLTNNDPAVTTWTQNTLTVDAIDDLNEILGLLVPAQPPDFPNSQSLSVSPVFTWQLCSGSVTDNTGDGLPAAGTDINTTYSAFFSSNTITESGPGTTGVVTAWQNSVGVGNIIFTTGNDNGLYTNLRIENNNDYPAVLPGFWREFDATIENATASAGYNKIQLTHTEASSSNEHYFLYDDQLSGLASVSGQSISDPGGLLIRHSSAVPHYRESQVMKVSATLNNTSGLTYRKYDFVTLGAASGGIFSTVNYDAGDAGMPANPIGKNAGALAMTNANITTANVHNQGLARARVRNPNGGNYASIAGTTVLVMGAPTTSRVDEDYLLVNGLGTTPVSDYAGRIEMTGSDTPSASFTGFSPDWNSGSMDTWDAAVVGGILRHDTNDYSSGHLPVGPDFSSQDTDQYITVLLRRRPISKFDIDIEGEVAGCWVKLVDVSEAYSSQNGWWDMTSEYGGAGVPGDQGGANGDLGCALSGTIPTGSAIDDRYTCTFGTESSTNATNNNILVRIKLQSGQEVSRLAFRDASN